MIRIASFISAFMLLTGCRSAMDVLEPLPVELLGANTFIEDLSQGTVLGEWIVQGSVTTSDECGNFYQSMYIQDATGALEVRFSFYDSYKLFRAGEVVSVKLFDYQIRSENNQLYVNVGNLSMVSRNVLRQGVLAPVVPLRVELSQIDSTLTGRLIEISGGEFANAGKEAWSGEQRYIAGKESIMVYTSALSSFAKDILPLGKLTMRGILTLYKGRFQLKISSPSDVNIEL